MLESTIQASIEAALGAEPDLLLLRNTVGFLKYVDASDGHERRLTYGLGTGSPDLVCLLSGRWFCLEVKRPGEKPTAAQLKCHDIWRRFGALVYVVTSAQEARDALADARARLAA